MALRLPPLERFQSLAVKLAPRVNVFHDLWERDRDALLYGGTPRDFLYWLRGQFADAETDADVAAIEARLLTDRRPIDVRAFIVRASDIDIVSARRPLLRAEDYGVTKIDWIPTSRLESDDEQKQGYLPTEKIRLGRRGFVRDARFGDGVLEIWKGRVTGVFPDDEAFAETKLAREYLNHPVLLALRYLRQVAVSYYYTHGQGYPDTRILFDMDPRSAEEARRILAEATVRSGGKLPLTPHLEKEQFRKWFDDVLRKAFRSYTNPTAARLLFERFGVDKLVATYGTLPTYNQYVFAAYRDEAAIERNLTDYRVDRTAFFLRPAALFADGHLYHGTRNEADFRSILFENVLPSHRGTAGGGLYGVAKDDVDFAEHWGGAKDRVVRLPVTAEARVVDVQEAGEGRRVWDAYRSARP
jgi:hypothetical protein